ncbi:hypothetical protein [Pseudomonas sp. B21-035]|uniref:hypothetical protein n=1 Tax=Pseudomonas sp. B21-035 TaxID=2895484 RepID=UPI00215DD7D6|nr:hypothetical protein [Pseudomonas sp. B21-035]UVL58312.1 hypothetical protein LOY22_10250 [Pseudomonas sp. B21-035]
MELHEHLDQVRDAETFMSFARALAADKSTSTDWENTTIEALLEGAIAWAESSDFGLSPQPIEATGDWLKSARSGRLVKLI